MSGQRPGSNPSESHFGRLLITLVILLAGTGLLDYSGRFLNGKLIITVTVLLLAQVLIVAVVSVPTRRPGSAVAIRVLVIATLIAQVLAALIGGTMLHAVAQAIALCCVGYAIVVVLGFLMRARSANSNTINAAISIYLLMGVFWAMLYAAIARVEPGAFFASNGNAPTMGHGAGSATALYFSFVTLTTLGYGDITPATTFARMSVVLEALIGQVYLVVLVARLVGLSASASPTND